MPKGSRRKWLGLAAVASLVAVGILAYFSLREPPPKDAATEVRLTIDHVNAVVRATGREPKAYATNAHPETCDHGDGTDGKYVSVDTGAEILDVTPGQAPILMAKIRDYFQSNGYEHLDYSNNDVTIDVSASKDGVGVGATYSLLNPSHRLAISGGSDCVVNPKDLPTSP
jgi:hypothetical protein